MRALCRTAAHDPRPTKAFRCPRPNGPRKPKCAGRSRERGNRRGSSMATSRQCRSSMPKFKFAPDSALKGAGFEPVWGFSCQVVVFGFLPVLCSEVCPGKASMFSRRQSCRGKSQSPVVWIAEEMETEPSKPIDKTSRGEVTSHRAVTTVNALWPRK